MKHVASRVALLATLCATTQVPAQLPNPSSQANRLLPYTQCPLSNALAPLEIQRRPFDQPKSRTVEIGPETRQVSVADGYRVILGFAGTAAFVNLKVEESVTGSFRQDKQTVLDQMQLMEIDAKARGVAINLERSTVQGVEIVALDNPTTQSGILSFISFFDDTRGVIASAYLLNRTPGNQAFENMDAYRVLRDAFVGDLARCMAANGGE